MTLQLDLPADIEDALRARAAAAGKDVSAYVTEVVAERLAEADAPMPRVSPEEFLKRLRRVAAMHPGSHGRMDDSRESIYAGRGE